MCALSKVVGEHISTLIQAAPGEEVKVDDLQGLYRSQYGYQLRPDNLGHNSMLGLLSAYPKCCVWKDNYFDLKMRREPGQPGPSGERRRDNHGPADRQELRQSPVGAGENGRNGGKNDVELRKRRHCVC